MNVKPVSIRLGSCRLTVAFSASCGAHATVVRVARTRAHKVYDALYSHHQPAARDFFQRASMAEQFPTGLDAWCACA